MTTPQNGPRPLDVVPIFPENGLVTEYANSSYTFSSGQDITIMFLRIPALSDEQIEQIPAGQPYKAPIVTSVTVPHGVARALWNNLKKNLGE